MLSTVCANGANCERKSVRLTWNRLCCSCANTLVLFDRWRGHGVRSSPLSRLAAFSLYVFFFFSFFNFRLTDYLFIKFCLFQYFRCEWIAISSVLLRTHRPEFGSHDVFLGSNLCSMRFFPLSSSQTVTSTHAKRFFFNVINRIKKNRKRKFYGPSVATVVGAVGAVVRSLVCFFPFFDRS